jgi:hypothetical protein
VILENQIRDPRGRRPSTTEALARSGEFMRMRRRGESYSDVILRLAADPH